MTPVITLTETSDAAEEEARRRGCSARSPCDPPGTSRIFMVKDL